MHVEAGSDEAAEDRGLGAEVVGGDEAGIYFNQNDPKSFAAAVMSISEDRAWLQRSIAGQKQALKFSWTKSAEALLETLKQI